MAFQFVYESGGNEMPRKDKSVENWLKLFLLFLVPKEAKHRLYAFGNFD